ncbi:MATE family efflux transporter [uncultured Alistipes sp.]|uniref:MATE family efflux transporter n=1 Tax=uncultured Alistipes sp. TaxID=538949 RepID=UPI00272D5072|nr:MATE family efflux transporter [uncultured Alistipes sp.]
MRFSDKEILKITFPVLLSLLMEQLIGLTDTAYLGRIGETELGAAALAGIFYLVIFMLGFGFSIGAQVLMARRNGEKDYHGIGPVFTQGMAFLLLLAALLFTASRLWGPRLLRLLVESDQVCAAAVSYLNWRVYGFFFSFTAAMFRAFYVATTRTRILTSNSVVMVLTNMVLNYVLIFGKWGFPALGIAGAAIASSLSEAVSVLFFIVYTRLRADSGRYGLFRWRGIDFPLLGRILSVSVWIMAQEGFAFFAWLFFFVAIEHLGERPLAISNIVRSVSSFIFMFVNAFASTASSLVSNLIGAGQSDRVLELCRRMIRLCYLFVLPVVLLAAVFPTHVLRIYTDNAELIAASVGSLRVMLSSFVVCGPAIIYQFSVSGTGNTRAAMIIVTLTAAIYMLYICALAFGLHADVALCWSADHVYYLVLLSSYFYLRFGHWKRRNI